MTPPDILAKLLRVDGMGLPQLTPLLTDEPKLPVYMARLGDDSWGQGAHPDPVLAQLKAVGEALERSCLLTPADDGSIQARYGDLDGQVDPADFYCYSAAQTDDYDEVIDGIRGMSFHWTLVRDSATGRAVYVPREFVYLDAANYEARPIRRESVSSGAAIGLACTQDAFRRALFELIERDAFMAVWLRGESPKRIGGFSGAIANLLDLLKRYRLDCRLFDLRSDYGVPAVFALTLDFSGVGPAVTSGLSAAENYEAASESAILESISYRRQARLNKMSQELPQIQTAAEIVSAETRIAYWSDPARLPELPQWTGQDPNVDLGRLGVMPCTAPEALERLTSQGCRVMQADITSPRAAAQGFQCVRVIVPELHPLYLSEAAAALRSAHLGAIAPAQDAPPHPFA